MGCLKSLTGNLLSDHSTLTNAVHPPIHRNRMRAGHKEMEVKGRGVTNSSWDLPAQGWTDSV